VTAFRKSQVTKIQDAMDRERAALLAWDEQAIRRANDEFHQACEEASPEESAAALPF
jgi:DNA-binding GntR family transcriptional regulator